MTTSLHPPLRPRNGHTLMVLGIARISTEHQDERSLEDQQALYRRWLAGHTGLPYHLEMISGRGSGECLDRAEALRATAEVETETYDLVLAEDLGRIFRRVHAQLFCELCEDAGTRLVAINDNVDTGRDDWRVLAGFATLRHEMYNADTSKRIRRSLQNRFDQGGVVQSTVYGYIKPPGADHDSQLRKDPEAEPVYAEIFRLLEDGASFGEVADRLNELGVKPGPCARSARWYGAMVGRLVRNPILKGVRVRNRKTTVRVNATGRRKAVDAPPSERRERHCPHLAFIQPARYDRLMARLAERNGWAKHKSKQANGADIRKGVPKKRTVWPGQHLTCGVCGRLLRYGGHGQKGHLLCAGASEYRCWNATSVCSELAAAKLMAAIRGAVAALPDYNAVLLAQVEKAMAAQRDVKGRRLAELARRRAKVQADTAKIVDAIKEARHSSTLLGELQRLENEDAALARELEELERQEDAPAAVPPVAEVKAEALRAFAGLAVQSQEFGRLMRRLVPRIELRPYRRIDGGHPVLRAHLIVSLTPLLPQPGLGPLGRGLERSLVVDLFKPPQHERHRPEAVRLRAAGLKQKAIAARLGITETEVQRAAALARRMEELGVTDAYQPLAAPPEDYNRLRRHKHPRYRFEPLPAPPPA